MSKRHQTKIRAVRRAKFADQQGRCHYCRQAMWEGHPEEFASRHAFSLAQAFLLRSTAEHLVPHGCGGADSAPNIVAACWYCNAHRHRSARPLLPDAYQAKVLKRMVVGRWHGLKTEQAGTS